MACYEYERMVELSEYSALRHTKCDIVSEMDDWRLSAQSHLVESDSAVSHLRFAR